MPSSKTAPPKEALQKEAPWKETWKNKLVLPEAWTPWAERQRLAGKTIATLNGSFDLLHAGHLHILYEASKEADLLLVALNSDASIRSYKGAKRPLIPLTYRLQMVAALKWVDFVTWFEEADPREFLKKIAPDVHVNGAEYGRECIEAATVHALGGRLHLVDRIEGLSSSALVASLNN